MITIILSAIITLLPFNERSAINKVAREYELTSEQTALLYSIRKAENGAWHKAFGIEDPRCRTYNKQLLWAANTIRKRYTGDLEAFASRWCPLNKNVWLKNVGWFMKQQGYNK